MQSQRKGSYLWLGIVLVLIFVMFSSSVIGGVVGFSVARKWSGSTVNGAAASIPALTIEPVNNVAGSGAPQQTLSVTEQSASVETVSSTLPAVVTVLTQSGFGGGSGSGFFISQDGYVVTNNHVVEGANDIAIIYAKGGTASATVVGVTPEFDLAVIKVDGPVPATLTWGDSSELPLGGTVIAIGSALGQYQNSVTSGVLSGYNRQLAGMGGLLQTDAAINQGNSGGPLLNLAGQVIGINTMVARGQGDVEGMGFAIPSNTAQNVVKQLIDTGEARYPFLGVNQQALNPQLANETGLNVTEGALIDSVLSNTPADRAQLRAGDVIVALNGRPVDDRHPLVSLLLEHVAGDTITLDVLRDGQIFQTQLTLGERA
ncbi:MAG: trypsin-like peptidase domain-containing protein [Anaerolineae bacterium]|nr:trypsin-like peptidase domain-containing protein [Anaerolineae bacterium]